jgi:dienelactone hydrolase
MAEETKRSSVRVPVAEHVLLGDLGLPAGAGGAVLFAHGSGSSRHSPRNRFVARALERRGLATLLVDLLTASEEIVDERTAWYRFDIEMLADRLGAVLAWVRHQPELASVRVGLFGASTGGGAALVAASRHQADVAAVVSRGGRPDLAGAALAQVSAPTLLIVGGLDEQVIAMNRDAMRKMHGVVDLVLVPGATHLFEEPGTLEQVAELAGGWFEQYLRVTPGEGA